ncbi:MAG: hypothetical protein QXI18_04855 [Nitrososphaerota archaeon]
MPHVDFREVASCMGKVSKGVKCSVAGCAEKAVKSVSAQRIPSSMKIEGSGRRAYLCETHWKQLKKMTREQQKVERMRRVESFGSKVIL